MIAKLLRYVLPYNLYSYLDNKMKIKKSPYRCPVCASRVYKFIPIGDWLFDSLYKNVCPYSPFAWESFNAMGYSCPNCGASDRARLYMLFLAPYLNSLDAVTKYRILDIAPDPLLTRYIKKYDFIEYRSADLYTDFADDKIDVMDMHIYDDEQFDFIMCSHVLEHVADDRKALREIYRVMKKGAKGIIMVPICLTVHTIDEDPTLSDGSERWRRFGQGDHVRIYSKQGFMDRVVEAGFKIHQYDKSYFGQNNYSVAGLNDRSVLYLVEK